MTCLREQNFFNAAVRFLAGTFLRLSVAQRNFYPRLLGPNASECCNRIPGFEILDVFLPFEAIRHFDLTIFGLLSGLRIAD